MFLSWETLRSFACMASPNLLGSSFSGFKCKDTNRKDFPLESMLVRGFVSSECSSLRSSAQLKSFFCQATGEASRTKLFLHRLSWQLLASVCQTVYFPLVFLHLWFDKTFGRGWKSGQRYIAMLFLKWLIEWFTQQNQLVCWSDLILYDPSREHGTWVHFSIKGIIF